MGKPNHGQNPNKSHPVFLGLRMRGRPLLEIQLPSLRVAVITKMIDEEMHKLCLKELEEISAKRLKAQ